MDARPSTADIILRAVVWGFVGLIFGFIFSVLDRSLDAVPVLSLRYAVATAAAGAIGALVYGNLRLAVIISSVAFVAITGQLILFSSATTGAVLLTGSVVGLVVGAVYARLTDSPGLQRADAKALAGASAGLLASLLVIVPSWFIGEIPYPWLTAVVCPVTGLVYVAVSRQFSERFSNLLPPLGDGALVGAGIGLLIGLLFLLAAGSVDNPLSTPYRAFTSAVLDTLAPAVLGAAAGALLAGAARALLGRPDQIEV